MVEARDVGRQLQKPRAISVGIEASFPRALGCRVSEGAHVSGAARRLADAFVARLGYAGGTVDEADLLARGCDFILSKRDGLTFSIVCIIDAESSDSPRFQVEKQAAKDILATCCDRYCGTLAGAQQPAVLVIVEVRASLRDDDLTRLRLYSNRFFDRNAIHAFVVDCSARRVVTATRFSFLGGLGWRRFLRRELAQQDD